MIVTMRSRPKGARSPTAYSESRRISSSDGSARGDRGTCTRATPVPNPPPREQISAVTASKLMPFDPLCKMPKDLQSEHDRKSCCQYCGSHSPSYQARRCCNRICGNPDYIAAAVAWFGRVGILLCLCAERGEDQA